MCGEWERATHVCVVQGVGNLGHEEGDHLQLPDAAGHHERGNAVLLSGRGGDMERLLARGVHQGGLQPRTALARRLAPFWTRMRMVDMRLVFTA